MATTEQQFDAEMQRCISTCRDLGYNPAFFAQMVAERGALATAKQLINDDTPSDGFTKLWELQHLELTVEAVALDPRFAGLFTQAERLGARRRLESYGYRPRR